MKCRLHWSGPVVQLFAGQICICCGVEHPGGDLELQHQLLLCQSTPQLVRNSHHRECCGGFDVCPCVCAALIQLSSCSLYVLLSAVLPMPVVGASGSEYKGYACILHLRCESIAMCSTFVRFSPPPSVRSSMMSPWRVHSGPCSQADVQIAASLQLWCSVHAGASCE